MQQHSGQHILSQAFIRRANAHTVGFHLSENSVTIDLQPSKLTPEDIEAAETLANRIVWEDRPITARLMSLQQAKDMELRKLPDVEGELVRLIDIDDFDLTACGGTHVSRTGAVGIIKILKLEQRGEQLRVEFNCGQRALVDYRQKNFILTRLASELTTGYWEVEQSVAKLRDELKQAQRDTRQQRQEVMALLAQQLLHDANEANGLRLVVRAFDDKEPDDLKSLAAKLVEHENVVALLGLAGEKTRLLFACSDQVPGVMNELLKPALQVIGSSGGGGSPRYAQGGGPAASLARVQQALTRAERLLLAQVR
jgi:alanyl-tRNA synthetase